MKYSILYYYRSFLESEGIPIGTLIETDNRMTLISTESSIKKALIYDPEINREYLEANIEGMKGDIENSSLDLEEYVKKYVNEFKFGEVYEIEGGI